MKKIYKGNLVIKKGEDKSFDYTEIIGSIYVYKNTKVSFPNLTSNGGGIYVNENAKASFPNLTSNGGSIYVRENAKASLPNLTSNGGSIYVYKNTKISLPNLTSNGGGIYVNENAKASFPNLTSNGGGIYVNENAKASFPNLTSNGGSIYVYKNTKANFNKNIIINDNNIQEAFLKNGYLFADKILSKIVSTRKQKENIIYKVIVCGELKKSYVVYDSKNYSHGDTLKLALIDLRLKNSDRDISDFENIDLTKSYKIEFWAEAYHVITGSCDKGIKLFLKRKNINKNILTFKEVLNLTKGEYNFDMFYKFFKK